MTRVGSRPELEQTRPSVAGNDAVERSGAHRTIAWSKEEEVKVAFVGAAAGEQMVVQTAKCLAIEGEICPVPSGVDHTDTGISRNRMVLRYVRTKVA